MISTLDSAPCGTEAAYNRHRRHGEAPCQACTQAASQARMARRAQQRGTPVQVGDVVSASELDVSEELGRVYAMLRARLEEAPPGAVPAIAGRMVDILKIVLSQQSAQGPGPSVVDELERLRRERHGEGA